MSWPAIISDSRDVEASIGEPKKTILMCPLYKRRASRAAAKPMARLCLGRRKNSRLLRCLKLSPEQCHNIAGKLVRNPRQLTHARGCIPQPITWYGCPQTGTTIGNVQLPISSVRIVHIFGRSSSKPAGSVQGVFCPKKVRVWRRITHGKSGQQHWGSSN
jgi:hypothetical protein